MGIMTKAEALKSAASEDKDLVEISGDAQPPVVKIVDWGKFNYQRTKQQQKNRKNARATEIKQIRMGLKIGDHDLDIKLRKAVGFLEAGHKVKITLVYRGRELAHKDTGYSLADKITDKLGDQAIVDQTPQFIGRQLNFIVRKGNAKVKNPQGLSQESVGNQDRQGSV